MRHTGSRAGRVRAYGLAVITSLAAVGCGDTAGPEPDPEPVGPSLTIVEGGSGSDTIQAEFQSHLVVEVRARGGGAASSEQVQFRVVSGATVSDQLYLRRVGEAGGKVPSLTEVTDGAGRAAVVVVAGERTGETKVHVTVPSLELGEDASFVTLPGAPVRIDIAPRDTMIIVADSFPFVAEAKDRFANVVDESPVELLPTRELEVTDSGWVRAIEGGRGLVRVQSGDFSDSALVSSVPNGVLAVYQTPTEGGAPGFAQVNLDGSGQRWIARTVRLQSSRSVWGFEKAPAWIHGTDQLVYQDSVARAWRLMVGDRPESRRWAVDSVYGGTAESMPQVSLDGEWIYFIGRDASDGLSVPMRVAVSGGPPERLTHPDHGREFRSPTPSPDGSQLAYVARTWGWEDFRLHLLDLSTGVQRTVSSTRAAGPVWSPDGEWILYTESHVWPGYSGQLRMIRPDGTGDQEVTPGRFQPGGTWSPDGLYLLVFRADPVYGFEVLDLERGISMPVLSLGAAGPTWRRQ